VRVVGELPSEIIARLATATKVGTIGEVLLLSLGDIVDVIVQDEYTHDVVVRAAAPAHLVFDTT
jgi:hypothetical protein